jgi:hypothetical protein
MILYLKDPKNLHQTTPRHHKHLQQSSRIQNQLTKISSFLYTSNEQTEKEYRKTIPFIIASKNKIPGINLTKKVKDLYNDNYKPLEKEIKDYRRWNDLPCLWTGSIVKMANITKSNLHVQCNPHENSNDIHPRD